MGLIDIFIPFIFGLFLIISPTSFIKPDDPAFARRKSLIKKGGITLIGVAIFYGIIKYISQ